MNMKLIDADKLKVTKFQNDTMNPVKKGWNKAVYYIDNIIRNAPTIDAVEVVRCKDCKNADVYDDGDCMCLLTGAWKKLDHFCSDGERKEDR